MTDRTEMHPHMVGSLSSSCASAAVQSLKVWGVSARILDFQRSLLSDEWRAHDAWTSGEFKAPFIVWIGPTSSSSIQETLSLVRFYLLHQLGYLSSSGRIYLIGPSALDVQSPESVSSMWSLVQVLEGNGIPLRSLRQVAASRFDGVVSRYMAASRSLIHKLKNGEVLPPNTPTEVVLDAKCLIERMAEHVKKMQDDDMSETSREAEMLQRLEACCEHTLDGLEDHKADWRKWNEDRRDDWASANHMCDRVLVELSDAVN